MMHLPTLRAPRGPIHIPQYRRPQWLDSTSPTDRQPCRDDGDCDLTMELLVAATGGFCAPVEPLYSFFGPPTDHELFLSWKRERESELAAQRWRSRAKRWWRAHWWPAIIADLTAQLRDEDYYD